MPTPTRYTFPFAGFLAPVIVALGLLAPEAGAQAPAAGGPLTCDNPALNMGPGDYPNPLVSHTGNAVEPRSGRGFFLDFPCGLEPGDPVTIVLNLHGGGSLGNWQRHYFPIYDYKDAYQLVIATPDAGEPGPGTWNPAVDDAYLQGVVDFVFERFAAQDVRAFWMAGHSFGGATTRRLICTEFYRGRVVGFVSLSGWRVGSPTPGRGGEPPALPDCDFSHIFAIGEHEASGQNLAATSLWADHLGCSARVAQPDIVDTEPGRIWDNSRQDPGTASWGFLPRPGRTEWWVYPNCSGGRVVADLVRIDKGHTEGLEPRVTEEIVRLMLSATR